MKPAKNDYAALIAKYPLAEGTTLISYVFDLLGKPELKLANFTAASATEELMVHASNLADHLGMPPHLFQPTKTLKTILQVTAHRRVGL